MLIDDIGQLVGISAHVIVAHKLGDEFAVEEVVRLVHGSQTPIRVVI